MSASEVTSDFAKKSSTSAFPERTSARQKVEGDRGSKCPKSAMLRASSRLVRDHIPTAS